ncbi:MAG: hypothetical protein F4Y95_10260 [Chloroflexi bacterium]|nr:hypothetical protein [Chloroflexota bacterium]
MEEFVPEEIAFVVNGTLLRLSRHDVESSVRGLRPEPIQRHAVEIAGARYPVKQAFEAATGLDRLDFTSAVARRNLGRLGFVLLRIGS